MIWATQSYGKAPFNAVSFFRLLMVSIFSKAMENDLARRFDR